MIILLILLMSMVICAISVVINSVAILLGVHPEGTTGPVIMTIFIAVVGWLNYRGYRAAIAHRQKKRHENFLAWLEKDLPKPRPQKDWAAFEEAEERRLERDGDRFMPYGGWAEDRQQRRLRYKNGD